MRKDKRRKTIDLDAILAIQEADKETHDADFDGAGIEEPRSIPVSAELKLHFSQSERQSFVEHRKVGLATKSLDLASRN